MNNTTPKATIAIGNASFTVYGQQATALYSFVVIAALLFVVGLIFKAFK